MPEKIQINLLPVEFIAQEAKKGKFYKVQAIGILVILFMIFLSIVTVSLRVFQSNSIKSAEVKVANAKSKVESLSSRQSQLILLKDRLDAINKHLGASSKEVELYNLVEKLIPPSVSVGTISVGNGKVLINASATDFNLLDGMFSDLISKEKNEDKISKILVENISRGRDSNFRLSLTIEGK